MQGVVPAAGAGTRLGDLGENTQKGLVEVAGRPLLAYVFDRLLEVGVAELFVVIGHGGEDIIARFGDQYGDTPITYVHQREPLGLAHAIAQTEPHIDDAFIVLNGDNIFGTSINPAIDAVDEGAHGAILVESVSGDEPPQTGVIETEGDRITHIVEKPREPSSQLVTTGCYVLPEAVFHACALVQPSETGEYELSEAVALLARAGYDITPVRFDGWRVNVNTPEDIHVAERLLTASR